MRKIANKNKILARPKCIKQKLSNTDKEKMQIRLRFEPEASALLSATHGHNEMHSHRVLLRWDLHFRLILHHTSS